MAQLDAFAPTCLHCGGVITVSPRSALTPVSCPHCQSPLLRALSGSHRLGFTWQPRWVRSVSLSFAISMFLHLLVIIALALVVIKPQIVRFDFVTTLIRDLDGDREEEFEIPFQVPVPGEALSEESTTVTTDAFETIGLSGIATESTAESFIAGGIPGRDESGARPSVGNSNGSAGFSAAALDRLKRHASVKEGAYEIALFWDGPSDLDLHVYFLSPTENVQRQINFAHMGNPATGFLDLDQNAAPPFNDEPIEHIRWNSKKPPPGFYQVLANGFVLRSKEGLAPKRVSYIVEIKTPEGVNTYRGSVAEDEFALVETLTVGRASPRSMTAEAQAERLFETATALIASAGPNSDWAHGLLKLVIRRFPATAAAQQAREVIQHFGME